ncbi:MAG: 3-oxoacyl-ACP synthase [Betaproteobacteria bacterium RBG_16_64_18]|nr:MAG: 3-oxoacyl-ACP synthase [Betaproteobacteria bacterium RBG_16_64_18]OGA10780.1 MAG: 3-oxoacyl-ACP synthase [Betaproteobacteria bacterium RIFCSPLOWO2_02_FULL_65_20]
MIYSRIVGTGSCLPPKIVTNAELAAQMDTSDEWIRTRTGIRQRHIAEASQTSSDLALPASREALSAAGLAPSDVDLIIVATSTPDYVFPSTACLLQAKLGIKGCPAFDIQAVCSGFVYGLAVADKFIRSGQHKCALVVGAEVFSRILDWNDRGTAVLFGDGAGAAVLRADSRPGVMASALHADGSHAGILSVPGNVCGGKVTGSPFLRMDGKAVFKLAVKVLDEVARETLAQCGLTTRDIDWLIPHQANARIIQATANKLGIDASKLVITVDRHANTSAASVPLALDLALRDGRIRPGQRVMLEGVGGGFTWGAVLVEM